MKLNSQRKQPIFYKQINPLENISFNSLFGDHISGLYNLHFISGYERSTEKTDDFGNETGSGQGYQLQWVSISLNRGR